MMSKSITNTEYEEYQRLLANEEHRLYWESVTKKHEEEREKRYQKEMRERIEQMREEGTLRMGEW